MTFLYIPLAAWASIVGFYYLYLGAINVWENRHETSTLVLMVSAPLLLTMITVDVLMQMTLASLIFWDVPREWTVTRRLARYRDTGSGWRKHWATEICTRALNPFDPTKKHC
jgi:hypothetical protein